jgi:hypothetical protein
VRTTRAEGRFSVTMVSTTVPSAIVVEGPSRKLTVIGPLPERGHVNRSDITGAMLSSAKTPSESITSGARTLDESVRCYANVESNSGL